LTGRAAGDDLRAASASLARTSAQASISGRGPEGSSARACDGCSMTRSRAIIHLDMDAFYAAVEVLDDPSLQGRPVIVGGPKARGVVSSASYEARRFGVHSAQPMATAMRLCPQGVFLPVRMARYREVSHRIFEIFRRFTPLVEPLSIDEAFLDVTGSVGLFGPPAEIARKIKEAVRVETGLTVSAGVAPCKFVAKIASDLRKPDGLTVVPEGEVKEFLAPLPIERLWGVGRVTREALALIGVRTIGDLSRIPLEMLEAKFGRQGIQLHLLSQGIDDRDVETEREPKSIGSEETFQQDLLETSFMLREILSMSMRVSRRLRREGLVGRTVTLKVKYKDFAQATRSLTLPHPTDDGREVFGACRSLLMRTQAGTRPVRLLGVSVSQLRSREQKGQLSLFEKGRDEERRRRLSEAVDRILDKFGEDGIVPGTLLEKE
jgi:DNA polymerase-4